MIYSLHFRHINLAILPVPVLCLKNQYLLAFLFYGNLCYFALTLIRFLGYRQQKLVNDQKCLSKECHWYY